MTALQFRPPIEMDCLISQSPQQLALARSNAMQMYKCPQDPYTKRASKIQVVPIHAPYSNLNWLHKQSWSRVVYTPTPQINGISGTIYGLNI